MISRGPSLTILQLEKNGFLKEFNWSFLSKDEYFLNKNEMVVQIGVE